MDFRWSDDEQAFRDELASFLDGVVPQDYDAFALPEHEWAANARRYGAQLAEKGFLTPSWPSEFGGRDASPYEQVIVAEEMVLHGEPFDGRGGPFVAVHGSRCICLTCARRSETGRLPPNA